jgi:small subunit ribosomal protein S17
MTDDSAPQSGAPDPELSGTDEPGETAGTGPATETEAGAATQAEAGTEVGADPQAEVQVGADPQAEAGSHPQAEAGPGDGGAAASGRAGDAAADSSAADRSNRRKVREGLVLSVAMDKTAVVGVVDRVRHPRYAKTVQRTKRIYAHDENNDLRVGDRVRLAETRPMSRLKRWRVVDVLERAK